MGQTKRNAIWAAKAAALLAMVLGGVLFCAGKAAGAATDLQWTWMKGSNTIGQPGVYGTILTPDSANTPGARDDAVSWTDPSGVLWLFGGFGMEKTYTKGRLNDLWKYEPSTGNWTWMKGSDTIGQSGVYGTPGVAAAANTPGARYDAFSWTDSAGALWLFGGYGYDGSGDWGCLNDLWKYDRATNQWAWMKGSNGNTQSGIYGIRGTAAVANTPGGRYGSVSWTDAAGALWLFGGNGYDKNNNQGALNDLWKYDPVTGNWTWMKGSDTINQTGIYGMLGTAAAGNTPGARIWSASWTDAAGALWLFGGSGLDGEGSDEKLNDLWKYDTAANNWTWVKGSSTGNQNGIYGTLGTAAAGNTPGARFGAIPVTDAAGALWLFGGYGCSGDGTAGKLNDLWKYDTKTGNWTWIKGADIIDRWGVYGTILTPAADNTPGARSVGVSWADASGGFWLFGGNGRDGYQSGSSQINDLWRIGLPDTAPPTGSIVINGNSTVTNNLNVTLGLTWADKGGSGTVRMKFSDDAVTWTAWEPLAAAKAWTLPAGEGYHTVRAMFRDKADNNSIVYSDYIRVDTIPPTGSIIINGGAPSTANSTVSLGLTWDDGIGSGVKRMRFSIDGAHWTAWEAQKTPKSYTLPATPGYYTVRVQYLDAGNNYSPVYNDYIKEVAP